MLLHREQQVREVAEHVRPDRFALERAGEPEHRDLVDGHREVIRPELRQPLDERPIRAPRRGAAAR